MPEPRSMRAANRPGRLAPAAVFFAALAAFLPAVRNQFVSWDDQVLLVENTLYRGLEWVRIKWMFLSSVDARCNNYQPLTWMTYGLDYVVWGMNPAGYHLTSALVHAANAAVFYAVCVRLFKAAAPEARGGDISSSAAVSALLFAVHPLRAEAAVWASARAELVSGLFYLLAALFYLRRRLAAALAAFLLSLFSKGIGVTLPIALIILDFYPLRRLPADPRQWLSPAARRVWTEKIPYFLLAALFGAIGILAQARTGMVAPLQAKGIFARIAAAAYGSVFYLWKTIFPADLLPVYQAPARVSLAAPLFLFCAAAAAALAVVAVKARGRFPALTAAWAFYLVTLAPVIGLIPFRAQLVADRYAYLACLGWAAAAGAVVLRRLAGGARGTTLGAAAAVVAVLFFLSWRQTAVWHDSEKLWRYVLSVDPRNSVAHQNLGSELRNRGRDKDARLHYEEALRLNPDYGEAHYNLGNIFKDEGRLAEAERHYLECARVSPGHGEAHNTLCVLIQERGDASGAIAHCLTAVGIRPEYAEAHYNLGNAFLRMGRMDWAATAYEQALRFKPGLWQARNNLAVARASRRAP